MPCNYNVSFIRSNFRSPKVLRATVRHVSNSNRIRGLKANPLRHGAEVVMVVFNGLFIIIMSFFIQ